MNDNFENEQNLFNPEHETETELNGSFINEERSK